NRLCDEHPLPLPPAQLVWIRTRNAVRLLGKELCENFMYSIVKGASSRRPVAGQHLANLLAGAHGRMEGKRRFLENQRNSRTTDLLQFTGLGSKKILPIKMNSSARDIAVRGKKPH